MALLDILFYPNPQLQLPTVEVAVFDDALAKIVADMVETMFYNNGIGLAANQVNIRHRLFVMAIEATPPEAFINPQIIAQKDVTLSEEGCLSIPGVYDKVQRYNNITVRYHNLKGEVQELTTTALPAFCIQHEIDHLNGKVFVEHLSSMKQERIKKKMQKFYH